LIEVTTLIEVSTLIKVTTLIGICSISPITALSLLIIGRKVGVVAKVGSVRAKTIPTLIKTCFVEGEVLVVVWMIVLHCWMVE